MSDTPTFRRDLYRGTAAFYDEFRVAYPAELVDDLLRRTAPSGTGRLLDLACGPGTVTFALHGHFAEVLAVDQEPEAIEFAAQKAAARGVRNIEWVAGRAEEVDPDDEFELVTIGTAFHRLDRRHVADLAMRWLRSGGHLALLWGNTPPLGDAPWQRALAEVIVEWMDRTDGSDRLPPDLARHLEELPHSTVLEQAGFDRVARYEFPHVHHWTAETLVGFVYSTSLLPLAVLGDQAPAFENDVATRLRAAEPSGVYRDEVSFAYDLAYRPPGEA